MSRLLPARRRAERVRLPGRGIAARRRRVHRRPAGARGGPPLDARAAGSARVRRRPARAAHGRRPVRARGSGRAQPRRRRRPTHRSPRAAPAASAGSASPWAPSPSSAPPPRWPSPRRARSRATRSTRSSGPSRTPRPASRSATTPRARRILDNASGRLDEVDQLTRGANADAELVARHPRHVLRPGHPGRRPAACPTTSRPATRSRSSRCRPSPRRAWTSSPASRRSIPASAEGALLNAAQVLFTLDAAADQVCPDCGRRHHRDPAAAAGQRHRRARRRRRGARRWRAARRGRALRRRHGDQHQANGGKGGRPSTVNPPDNPVSIPPVTVDPDDATDGIDDVLPTGTTTGGTGNGNGDGNGGKKKPKPVDLHAGHRPRSTTSSTVSSRASTTS